MFVLIIMINKLTVIVIVVNKNKIGYNVIIVDFGCMCNVKM